MGVLLFIATLFVPLLNRDWRPEACAAPTPAGRSSRAWPSRSPGCPAESPTLGAILAAASTEDTVGEGGVLLAFYALGLAVPFILSALAFTTFAGVFRFFPSDHYPRDHARVRHPS